MNYLPTLNIQAFRLNPHQDILFVILYCYILICRFMQKESQRHNDKGRTKTSLKKYTSHFICNVCVWEGVGDWTKTAIYWPPTLMTVSVVSFSFSRAAQPEAQGPSSLLDDGFLYYILSPTGFQNSIGGPDSPFGRVWLSLPHLVSNSSDLQLLTSCLTPSYIIVQSPTQSLEWYV